MIKLILQEVHSYNNKWGNNRHCAIFANPANGKSAAFVLDADNGEEIAYNILDGWAGLYRAKEVWLGIREFARYTKSMPMLFTSPSQKPEEIVKAALELD